VPPHRSAALHRGADTARHPGEIRLGQERGARQAEAALEKVLGVALADKRLGFTGEVTVMKFIGG